MKSIENSAKESKIKQFLIENNFVQRFSYRFSFAYVDTIKTYVNKSKTSTFFFLSRVNCTRFHSFSMVTITFSLYVPQQRIACRKDDRIK